MATQGQQIIKRSLSNSEAKELITDLFSARFQEWKAAGMIDANNNPVDIETARQINAGLLDPPSVMLTGPSGVGKTASAKQARAILEDMTGTQWDIHMLTPCIDESPEYKGQKWVEKRADGKLVGIHAAFESMLFMVEAKRPTIICFEDLRHAEMPVQNALTQVLWARKLAVHEVSPWVLFMATTNRNQDLCGGQYIQQALLQRFTTIVDVKTTLDEYDAHAEATGEIHPWIIGYLRMKAANGEDRLVYEGPVSKDTNIRHFSPRNGAHASTLLRAGCFSNPAKGEKDRLLMAGCIGIDDAVDLQAFVNLFAADDMPSFDSIVDDPLTAKVPSATSTGKQWFLTGMLTSMMTDPAKLATRFPLLAYCEVADKVSEYVNRISGAFRAYYYVNCAKRDRVLAAQQRRSPVFETTTGYLHWVATTGNKLANS